MNFDRPQDWWRRSTRILNPKRSRRFRRRVERRWRSLTNNCPFLIPFCAVSSHQTETSPHTPFPWQAHGFRLVLSRRVPKQSQVPRTPDVTYELRAGTSVSGTSCQSRQAGQSSSWETTRSLIDRLPIDTVFHFHRYDPQKHEVDSGPNWCALRLLVKTKETYALGQDGIHWEIRIDDAHSDVIVNLNSKTPFPSFRIGLPGKGFFQPTRK